MLWMMFTVYMFRRGSGIINIIVPSGKQEEEKKHQITIRISACCLPVASKSADMLQ